MATETMEARPATSTAAEREARGKAQLAELEQQIAKATATADGFAEQLAALAKTVEERRAERNRRREALDEADRQVVTARAQALVADDPTEARERVKALESARTLRQREVAEAEERLEVAERQIRTEEPLLDKRQCQAREGVSELRRLHEALQGVISQAHREAGQDRLQALTERHRELLAARVTAWEAFTAAGGDIRRFYDDLPHELAEWPDLARLPLRQQVGHELTPSREVVESFLWYIGMLECHSGFAARLGFTNNSDLKGLLAGLDEPTIRDLMVTHGGRGLSAYLARMRATADRILELFG